MVNRIRECRVTNRGTVLTVFRSVIRPGEGQNTESEEVTVRDSPAAIMAKISDLSAIVDIPQCITRAAKPVPAEMENLNE
jgi:hypothetical protein